jgi:hypothetical protein
VLVQAKGQGTLKERVGKERGMRSPIYLVFSNNRQIGTDPMKREGDLSASAAIRAVVSKS